VINSHLTGFEMFLLFVMSALFLAPIVQHLAVGVDTRTTAIYYTAGIGIGLMWAAARGFWLLTMLLAIVLLCVLYAWWTAPVETEPDQEESTP
jgi:glucose-6-phosphate-specific signal transduction histidine kinase